MVLITSYLLPVAAVCSLVTALPQPAKVLPNMKSGNLPKVFSNTDKYPLPNVGNVPAHDPNLLEHKDAFYMFKGGVHIPIFKATDLNGPWKQIGTVLPGDSVIKGYGNATRPWAPTTVEWKGKFYCFYSLSAAGDQHSAIGVASTDNIEKGNWKDHGKLLTTNDPNQGAPFNETNAIDPSFIVDAKTGAPYLNYGSYWQNIWQIPLEDDLLSLKDTKVSGDNKKDSKHSSSVSVQPKTSAHVKSTPHPTVSAHATLSAQPTASAQVHVSASIHASASIHPMDDHHKRDQKNNNEDNKKNSDKDDHEDPHKGNKDGKSAAKTNKGGKKVENHAAVQLSFMPGQKQKPEEGSWVSHHDGYYYLWFSQGKCCDFDPKNMPPQGSEYHIRVGRSKNVSGPFKDKDGKDLLKSGGTTVYASNHGTVYAPGGLGVLPGNKNRPDVLYYHYLNTTIGLEHKQAQLGWNYLEYKNGWPSVRGNKKGDSSKPSS